MRAPSYEGLWYENLKISHGNGASVVVRGG